MLQKRPLLLAAAMTSLLGSVPTAFGQSWPARPLRLIVPFPPGGPTDSFARMYAAAMALQLGQSVVVENKAGASGALGTMEVKRAAADGHTLLFGTASTHALYNLIQSKPQYDWMEDFTYVGVLGGAPVAFAVAPNMPRTLKTVVIAARFNPGKYNYGSPGTGTLLHVAAERLKALTGAPITHVPYRGAALALQDVMGGTIEMTVDTLGSLLPHHKSGRVRIIGVASSKRLALAPDVPTVAESVDSTKPFEAMLWNVVAAPRGMPQNIMDTLTTATQKVMNDAAFRSRLEAQFMFADVHIGQTAAVKFIQTERAKWKPIIDTLGDLSSS